MAKRPDWAYSSDLMKDYYDQQWGFPVHDDNGLFKWLTLELFQSGLSWITILKRKAAFEKAFNGFDISKIAKYDEKDFERLLHDEGIIRNKLKIKSTIHNAKVIQAMQQKGQSFDNYIWSFVDGKPERLILNGAPLPAKTPESEKMAKQMKKDGFQFVGATTLYSFMTAAGLINAREEE
jgi:DNA-3-methyladenine glycosylase I